MCSSDLATHFVLVNNERSKQTGRLHVYESWTNSGTSRTIDYYETYSAIDWVQTYSVPGGTPGGGTPGGGTNAVASGTCGTNAEWMLDDKGVLTISGTGSMKNYSSPSKVSWYSYRSDIKQAVIKSGITSIGNYAFVWCENMTAVTIPDSVTSIGDSAFQECSGLTTVTIPDSVTSIGDSAFSFCSGLMSVTIGNGVTSIGEDAFEFCSSLTSVTIPDSVTFLGRGAFDNCRDLATVNIGKGVTNIVKGTFGSMAASYHLNRLERINVSPENQVYSSVDGVLFTKDISAILLYPNMRMGAYTIPESVTHIGESAFYACRGLTSLVCPDGLKTIGAWAFESCGYLKSIYLGKSLTSIGNGAFFQCGMKTIDLPDTLITIGDYAFDWSALTSITIPDSVTTIGTGAFSECYHLESVTIGSGVTTIGDWAFTDGEIKQVNYNGTVVDWNEIQIGSGNDLLLNAPRCYLIGSGVAGDINNDGSVTTKDVTMLRRAIAGGYGIEVSDLMDLNHDGGVTTKDVTMLRRAIAGGYGVEL